MKSLLKTVVPAGAVGGAVSGVQLWATTGGILRRDVLPSAGEAALTVLIVGVMGTMIGLIFGVIAGTVLRLRGNGDDLDAASPYLTMVSLMLGGAAGLTHMVLHTGVPGMVYLTATVVLVLIAAAVMSRNWWSERTADAITARWIGVLVGAAFFGLVLRVIASGTIEWRFLYPIAGSVGAVCAGYIGWYIARAILKVLAAHTSSQLATGIVTVLVVVLIGGIASLSLSGTSDYLIAQRAGELSAKPGAGHRPNIILISVDTLRSDCVGYTGGHVRTPTIDRLAGESYVFTRAYSIAPWTRPSFAAFFSSRYPSEMGVGRIPGVDAGGTRAIPYEWRQDRDLLAEIFKARGYATAAVVTNPNITRYANADQGFDLFHQCLIDEPRAPWLLMHLATALHMPTPYLSSPNDRERADVVSSRALTLLENTSARPLFLWLHYMDPHQPYDPPTIERELRVDPNKTNARSGLQIRSGRARQKFLNAYTAEIEYSDEWLAKVIQRLKASDLWESSLIVFWSDHGEEFWEHDSWEHGQSLFNELLHVPLLIRRPGQAERRTINQPVTLLDPMPTILDYCDVEAPEQMRGKSLLPLMRGEQRTYDCNAFLEGCIYGQIRKGLLTNNYKLIYNVYNDDFSLYDMRNDPWEQRNIYGTDLAPDTTEMTQRLLRWTDESHGMMQKLVSTGGVGRLSPEIRQHLRDMGYIQ